MNQISFKGNFITNANIKRAGVIPMPCKISVVELDPLKSKDLKALERLGEMWISDLSFNIFKEAQRINENGINKDNLQFFVLTEQKENFKNINPHKILAEASIIVDYPGKDKIYLDYLQVDPMSMHNTDGRVYKGVGTAFLKFLKKYYKGKEIQLRTLISATNFYLKSHLFYLNLSHNI